MPNTPPVAAVSDIRWRRELLETTKATCVVSPYSDGLDSVLEPWLFAMVVLRDAIPVWMGPVYTYSTARGRRMEITAVDVSTYFLRRTIHTRLQFTTTDLSTIAVAVIRAAMEPDDAWGVIPGMVVAETGRYASLTVNPDERTGGQVLEELVDAGLEWSVVAGRVVVGPVDSTLITLTDSDLGDGFQVVTDGSETVTGVTVRGKGVQATAIDSTSPVGILEQIVEVDAYTTELECRRDAAARVKANRIPARRVEPAGDARLLPTAPVVVEHLIPGAVVPVASEDPPVTTTVRLRVVDGASASAGDSVSIGLTEVPPALEPQEIPAPPHWYVGDEPKDGTPSAVNVATTNNTGG